MTEGYTLRFAFRDPSPSFAFGFALGEIRGQMRAGVPFEVTLMSELHEDVIALATAFGWRESIAEISDDWIRVRLTPERGNTEIGS